MGKFDFCGTSSGDRHADILKYSSSRKGPKNRNIGCMQGFYTSNRNRSSSVV